MCTPDGEDEKIEVGMHRPVKAGWRSLSRTNKYMSFKKDGKSLLKLRKDAYNTNPQSSNNIITGKTLSSRPSLSLEMIDPKKKKYFNKHDSIIKIGQLIRNEATRSKAERQPRAKKFADNENNSEDYDNTEKTAPKIRYRQTPELKYMKIEDLKLYMKRRIREFEEEIQRRIEKTEEMEFFDCISLPGTPSEIEIITNHKSP